MGKDVGGLTLESEEVEVYAGDSNFGGRRTE